MKTWWLIFGCLVALCLVVVVALLRSEPANGHGIESPRFETMQIGGDAARHDDLIKLGWIYGATQFVMFVTTLTLGLGRESRSLPVFVAAGAGLVVMFSAVIFAYAAQMHLVESPLFLGFPPSTAIMLFGLWPLPVVFVILYSVKFDSWILRPESWTKCRRSFAPKRIGKRSRD